MHIIEKQGEEGDEDQIMEEVLRDWSKEKGKSHTAMNMVLGGARTTRQGKKKNVYHIKYGLRQ